MENRDQSLLQMRSAPTNANSFQTKADEEFQNRTLRPVLALQNDLLVAAFRNYVDKHKNVFYDMCPEKKMAYIENSIQKDIKFRNSLKGMVIGLFSLAEYEYYITNSSALNKRMMLLVRERLQDNIQLLNPPLAG